MKKALLTIAIAASITAGAQELNYNEHIADIINENCVVCHRQGGIGPMQFETYEQVRPWAPLIQFKVANREMPPYAYDQHIGIQNLRGDWRLEDYEINAIIDWVNNGSPKGPEDVTPQAPTFPNPDEMSHAWIAVTHLEGE